MMIDPVDLTARLIQCPSVTPDDAGALDLIERELMRLGFTCRRLPFSQEGTPTIDNLYARLGTEQPHFCFAGHSDVVPAGAQEQWSNDPFSGAVENGTIWGRGAADMKGAIAAFISAVDQFINADSTSAPFKGSISLLITGDEEGPSINGTAKLVDWLQAQGEVIDACIVGEPTNPESMGDMIKIGRRGSANAVLTVHGRQGHVAYPHRAHNPIPLMVRLLSALGAEPLDAGTAHFQPSNLEVTSVDVGNQTTNVIPATATARLNIRYNDLWTAQILEEKIAAVLDGAGTDTPHDIQYEIQWTHSAACFRTEVTPFVEKLQRAIQDITGREAELSTSGGTSDARFIKDICPVVEFGLIGQTMHQVDEHVSTDAIIQLRDIYARCLTYYFSS